MMYAALTALLPVFKAPEMVNGIKQKPIEGVSMAYTFDQANANAPSKRYRQCFEMVGNRAIYHDGWVAATMPPTRSWQMGSRHDARRSCPITTGSSTTSPTTIRNTMTSRRKTPTSRRQLQRCSCTEAAKYQIFPMDNSGSARAYLAAKRAAGKNCLHLPRPRMSAFPWECGQYAGQGLHHHRSRDDP